MWDDYVGIIFLVLNFDYLNSKKPTKASNVTHITNRNIWYLFTMLVVMSVMCSVGYLVLSVNIDNYPKKKKHRQYKIHKMES